MGAAVGGSLLNKLNLGGLSGSMQGLGGSKIGGGYQPRMFGASKTDATDSGNTSERSFTSRFGQGNPVSASIDMPASHKFLGASGKNLMGPAGGTHSSSMHSNSGIEVTSSQ